MTDLTLKSIRFLFKINTKQEIEDQELALLHERDNKSFTVEKEHWIKIYFEPIRNGAYRVKVVKGLRKIYENNSYSGPIDSDTAHSIVSNALAKYII